MHSVIIFVKIDIYFGNNILRMGKQEDEVTLNGIIIFILIEGRLIVSDLGVCRVSEVIR